MTYRAIRGYKYILQLEDCIVLHWGMGNRFRSLRPTFPEDKLKREKKAISYHIRLPVCSFDVRYHSIIWPKKRGSSPSKKALLSVAFFVTNFPFRPFLRRPIHMVFVSNRLSCKVWSLYAAKGIFEQFWIADDIRGNLDVYVRLGDVDFKQTESISLIGRWNIYKRRSILIGWKYILNTEIPSSSTLSLHSQKRNSIRTYKFYVLRVCQCNLSVYIFSLEESLPHERWSLKF